MPNSDVLMKENARDKGQRSEEGFPVTRRKGNQVISPNSFQFCLEGLHYCYGLLTFVFPHSLLLNGLFFSPCSDSVLVSQLYIGWVGT